MLRLPLSFIARSTQWFNIFTLRPRNANLSLPVNNFVRLRKETFRSQSKARLAFYKKNVTKFLLATSIILLTRVTEKFQSWKGKQERIARRWCSTLYDPDTIFHERWSTDLNIEQRNIDQINETNRTLFRLRTYLYHDTEWSSAAHLSNFCSWNALKCVEMHQAYRKVKNPLIGKP